MSCEYCGGYTFYWEEADVWVCYTCPESLDDAVLSKEEEE